MGITERMHCWICPLLRESLFFLCCCTHCHCGAITQPHPMAASPMQLA